MPHLLLLTVNLGLVILGIVLADMVVHMVALVVLVVMAHHPTGHQEVLVLDPEAMVVMGMLLVIMVVDMLVMLVA